MKTQTRKSLYLAIVGTLAAAAAQSASAVTQSMTGTGSYLNYPYYTARSPYDTLMSVVNRTTSAKVVNVRFFESKNAREVLSFHLFLSPKDVWVAAIVRTPEGGAALKTADTSCTVPALPRAGYSFSNGTLRETDFNGNIIDSSLDRTSEGYMEVIEMARLDVGAPANLTRTNASGMINASDAATHVNGVPRDCGALLQLYPNIATVSPLAAVHMLPPNGGLFGSASLISISEGTDYSYDANAYNGLFATQKFAGLISLSSDLSEALPNACITADDSNVYCGNFSRLPGDAVSAAMMRSKATAEWVTETGIGASTDIVFNFPTKRFYVPSGEACRTATSATNPAATPPFSNNFCSPAPGKAREPLGFPQAYSRESRTTLGGPQLCFNICPQEPALLYTSQVVTINSGNVLRSTTSASFQIDAATSGWIEIDFASQSASRILKSDPNTATKNGIPCGQLTLRGLPFTGFSVQKYVNGSIYSNGTTFSGAPIAGGTGLLSNYGGNFAVKTEFDVKCE